MGFSHRDLTTVAQPRGGQTGCSQLEQSSHTFQNQSFQTQRWIEKVRKYWRAFCIKFPPNKIWPDFHVATPVKFVSPLLHSFFTLSLNLYLLVSLRSYRFFLAFCSINLNVRIWAKNSARVVHCIKTQEQRKLEWINRVYWIKMKTLFEK